MTPESRNSPLLDNGSLKRVSAAMDTFVETKALLHNGRTFRNSGYTPNNRPTVRGGDFYSVRPES
jgi:hypothetical protein